MILKDVGILYYLLVNLGLVFIAVVAVLF